MKRTIAGSLVALVVLASAFLTHTRTAASNPYSPMMAPPNNINVNSTSDILSPPAGVITLRSAIVAANADVSGNPTVINLTVAGTYNLTLANADEETAPPSGAL